VSPIPSFRGSTIATRRAITPTASSRLIRRQQGFCVSRPRLAICSIGAQVLLELLEDPAIDRSILHRTLYLIHFLQHVARSRRYWEEGASIRG